MNKFDALKMFQGWPPEWQRLCAECWIETGEVETTQVSTFGDKLSLVALSKLDDPFPFDQTKSAKVAAASNRRRTRRPSVSLAWSVPESEYLLKLASEQWEQCRVVQMFLDKYPGRSPHAVRRRVWGIRSGKESGEVKY